MPNKTYNPKVLYRSYSGENLDVILNDDETFSVQFIPPGIIQYGRLFHVFIDAFLPETLTPADKNKLTQDEKFNLALKTLNDIQANTTEENEEQSVKAVYTGLFLKGNNSKIIESIVRDCFELEASLLDDNVLMQLVSHLINLMSSKISD